MQFMWQSVDGMKLYANSLRNCSDSRSGANGFVGKFNAAYQTDCHLLDGWALEMVHELESGLGGNGGCNGAGWQLFWRSNSDLVFGMVDRSAVSKTNSSNRSMGLCAWVVRERVGGVALVAPSFDPSQRRLRLRR